MAKNRICEIFGIQYPIIQGGMIWCSGWELTSAVSNSGGLGLIGAGSMTPEIFRQHIRKVKNATKKPFGVNVPLIYSYAEQIIKIAIEEEVKIVFTSAGNPKIWTKHLQENGITVAHVVANSKFALKSQDAGADVIVAEGFEAGGHNGREETTTLTLIPKVKDKIEKPMIAAGGISSGKSMLAAMVLGADGVQIGSRFVCSEESSAHINFKNEILKAQEGSTRLSFKELIPVRLIKNQFCERVEKAELSGKSKEELLKMLGRGRAKLGMFDGDIYEGELEIGQVSASIDKILPVSQIIENIVSEYNLARKTASDFCF
ncbi:MAG: nitronate monooxygenase [Bacteroidetes bacterium]|jgi:enoyl-[acyl-carrier protein] reductase II|nr:nitronate monooxygenase [Bacteroidota bacterium]MBT6686494.1 nitronate monooxygenase [Bacteroidota bacterium]MBT7143332.1 nitronate monooxygenase [Bacteroidota bacterium]MBT7491548.1 nitronate monooxygenase [Bacteroidota bacterium]